MRLVLLGSRVNFVGKNNTRMNFGEIWRDEAMKYNMNKILNIYILILYEK